MTLTNQELVEQADALYERYAKPLENDHWGEYIAISKSGKFVVGADLTDVRWRSLEQLGKGSFVFKIGEMSIGKLR